MKCAKSATVPTQKSSASAVRMPFCYTSLTSLQYVQFSITFKTHLVVMYTFKRLSSRGVLHNALRCNDHVQFGRTRYWRLRDREAPHRCT